MSGLHDRNETIATVDPDSFEGISRRHEEQAIHLAFTHPRRGLPAFFGQAGRRWLRIEDPAERCWLSSALLAPIPPTYREHHGSFIWPPAAAAALLCIGTALLTTGFAVLPSDSGS